MFIGPMLLIITAGFLLVIVAAIVKVRTRRASLVLRSFEVHCTPQPPGQPLVEIVGRPAGIVAFVLTILQLQTQTTLSATDLGIEYEAASLSGQLRKFIPLSRVASMAAGVHKPVSYLIVAGSLFVLGALFSMSTGSSILLVIALLVVAILLALYFVSKSVLLEITSNAGIEISLCFRPGVIEGVPVDAEKAMEAAGVIRDLILERSPADQREGSLMGAGLQFGNRFGQSVATAQSVRHSPPPFVESMAPAVVGAANADGDHEEERAREALREAVRLYKTGCRDEAVTAMNRVIEEFPNTMVARTAQANLVRMRTEGIQGQDNLISPSVHPPLDAPILIPSRFELCRQVAAFLVHCDFGTLIVHHYYLFQMLDCLSLGAIRHWKWDGEGAAQKN